MAALAVLFVAAAAPALGQEGRVAPAAADEAAACEIHVWGTDNIDAYITGWSEAMGGGMLGPALDGRRADSEGVKSLLMETFAGPAQGDALRALPLATLLRLPSVRVISEPRMADPRRWKRTRNRLAESTSPCYGDIIIRSMYFLKTALFSPSLRVNFTYRYFGDRQDRPAILEGRGGSEMTLYPLVTTDDVERIKADFIRAYQADFEEFVREQFARNRNFPQR